MACCIPSGTTKMRTRRNCTDSPAQYNEAPRSSRSRCFFVSECALLYSCGERLPARRHSLPTGCRFLQTISVGRRSGCMLPCPVPLAAAGRSASAQDIALVALKRPVLRQGVQQKDDPQKLLPLRIVCKKKKCYFRSICSMPCRVAAPRSKVRQKRRISSRVIWLSRSSNSESRIRPESVAASISGNRNASERHISR